MRHRSVIAGAASIAVAAIAAPVAMAGQAPAPGSVITPLVECVTPTPNGYWATFTYAASGLKGGDEYIQAGSSANEVLVGGDELVFSQSDQQAWIEEFVDGSRQYSFHVWFPADEDAQWTVRVDKTTSRPPPTPSRCSASAARTPAGRAPASKDLPARRRSGSPGHERRRRRAWSPGRRWSGRPAGPAGPSGPVGPTGPLGPQGPEGQQGPAGEQGPAGGRGRETGATGQTGATGEKGGPDRTAPTGDQGAIGDQGVAGKDGAPGVTIIQTVASETPAAGGVAGVSTRASTRVA